MAKVTVLVDMYDEDEGRAGVRVLVDGVLVARGACGGEPEDNSIYRDYGWIIPMVASLAKALGAEFEEKNEKEEE